MNIKKKLPVILQLEHKVRLVLAYQKILGSGNTTLSSAIHVIFPETATVPVQYLREKRYRTALSYPNFVRSETFSF